MIMETITAFVLLLTLLTIFWVDASRKRRELLKKRLSDFWQESAQGHRSGTQTPA